MLKEAFADFEPRIDDESALRAKVDEALTVYDEYVKNKGGEGEAAAAPAPEESKKESEKESTEENKS